MEEIELNIGELRGIEQHAFDFAWKQGIKDTMLSHAKFIINKIPGEGLCLECNHRFAMHQLYDACPQYGKYFISIQQGKELRVKSLVVT